MGMTAEQGREYYAANREKLKGYFRQYSKSWRRRNPASAMFSRAKGNARTRGIPFELTMDWFKEHVSGGFCEATGLPFVYELGPFCPSIDRIDSEKGYTPSNCRVVVWMYNLAKHTWTDEQVLTMCEALMAHQKAL